MLHCSLAYMQLNETCPTVRWSIKQSIILQLQEQEMQLLSFLLMVLRSFLICHLRRIVLLKQFHLSKNMIKWTIFFDRLNYCTIFKALINFLSFFVIIIIIGCQIKMALQSRAIVLGRGLPLGQLTLVPGSWWYEASPLWGNTGNNHNHRESSHRNKKYNFWVFF